MRRKVRPPPPDRRAPWQVAQGLKCGCLGADDMCVCQNEEAPWRYGLGPKPPRDWSDHEDDFADAIADSIDVDWTPRDGARAIVRYLNSSEQQP